MSRYINYDALDYRNDKMHDKSSDFIDGVIYMAQRIEEAPSIDIVFCKDCKKHKVVPFGENACFNWCDFRCHAVSADSFCSFGERRGDE